MNRLNLLSSFIFVASLIVSGTVVAAQNVPADHTRDTVKDVPNHLAVSPGTCFFAVDQGKSLTEGSCDVRALQASAKEGQVYAQNQLGLVSALVTGQGTDIRQARSWFEKAARRGYAPAQVNLAVTYINGWGTTQNYGAALNWLNAAAKQGHPSAYANLGILYMNGWHRCPVVSRIRRKRQRPRPEQPRRPLPSWTRRPAKL